MSTRYCRKCRTAKPTGEFAVARDKRSGRRSVCKPCDAARFRAYYQRKRSVRR